MTLTLPLGSVDNVACLDDDDEDNDVHAARSVWSRNLIPRLEHSLPRSYTCPLLTKDDDDGYNDYDDIDEYNNDYDVDDDYHDPEIRTQSSKVLYLPTAYQK